MNFEVVHSSAATDCVTDLDDQLVLLIFESILTSFEGSIIFLMQLGAVLKIGFSLKPKHYQEI